MKKMSKIVALVTCMAMMFSLAACSSGGSDKPKNGEVVENQNDGNEKIYKIGISQFIKHEALDAATKGFRDALTEKFGDKVVFDEQNAQGDSPTCAVIANGFVSSNVDLILANATPALQSTVAATGDIPVLGTSVTEYGVALDIADFNGTVGGNVSGTSDLAPLDQQANMIKELFPNASTVGILFCSAEPNSIYQVNTIKGYLEGLGYSCELYPFSDSNDISPVTTNAASKSDVIYVPTDNTVASNTGIIDNICRPSKIPVITGEKGPAAICGVATLSIDYYDLGYATGQMACEILTGESNISEMPVQYAPKFTKMYNKEIAEELGVVIPDGYTVIE